MPGDGLSALVKVAMQDLQVEHPQEVVGRNEKQGIRWNIQLLGQQYICVCVAAAV